MRVMINCILYEIIKAYKYESPFSGLNLVLKTAEGARYSFLMSEGDIDFALKQLYEEGKLIGNWKM